MKHFLTLQFLLLASLLSTSFLGKAQDDEESFKEEIEIVKPYKPKITDAVKLPVQAGQERLEIEQPTLEYDTFSKPFEMPPDDEKLPAVSLGSQKLDPLKRSYIKLGAGNYANVAGEAHYNSLRNEDQLLTGYFKHRSGKGPVDQSQFGKQTFKTKAAQYYDATTLAGNVHFNNELFRYYGFDHDNDQAEEDSIKQRYTRYGIEANFNNDRADTSKLNYGANVGFDGLSSFQGTEEINVSVGGRLKEYFQGNAVEIKSQYDYYQYNYKEDFERHVFKLQPHYILNHEMGQAKIGFNIANEQDSTGEFHFYPDIEAEIPLIEDKLIAFGGIKGDLKVNSYQSLTKENRYLHPRTNIRNTNHKLNISAGIKGRFKDQTAYQLGIHYQNVENFYYFVNNPEDPKTFKIQYDSAVTAIVKIHGELDYQVHDNFKVALAANYRQFTLASSQEPWHRPNFDFKTSAFYKIGDKVRFHTNIMGYSQRKALDDMGEAKNLDGIIDLNFGIDYSFSNAFTAYFNFNNILAQEYEYWNKYPRQGFHVMGGVKLNLF